MVRGPEGQLSFSKSTESHLYVNLKFRLYLYFEQVRLNTGPGLKMTGFALKTEIEMFENASRLLSLWSSLLHLLICTIDKDNIPNVYVSLGPERVFRCCMIDI